MEKLAFLFPGQGSQYVGMGKDIRENFALGKQTFEEADEALHMHLTKLCFDGPESDLKLTQNTQPAVLTVSIAIMRVLQSETGHTPSMLAGHSLGEYSALVTSGALCFEDAIRIVQMRGKFMQEAVPAGQGSMAAILGLDQKTVDKICNECAEGQVLSPANFNCPGQIVISGHTAAVQRASAMAKKEGARDAIELSVSAPFHCSLMQSAAERLAEALQPVAVHDLTIPVLSNVEAEPYPSREALKELLVKQVTHPVRWQQSVEKMIEEGIRQFFELGPGRVLTGLMKRINRGMRIHNIENKEGIKKAENL